jgi:hypothetical protein
MASSYDVLIHVVVCLIVRSHGSLVSIATRLRAGRPGFDSRLGMWNLLFRHSVQTISGVHPASYPMGFGEILSSGAKWPEYEAKYLSPSSTKVKNTWNYTSTPPIRLHGVALS